MDYKNTLNLPRTDFSMKADLVAREPQRLARWEADAIYAQIRAARAGREKFILHDGCIDSAAKQIPFQKIPRLSRTEQVSLSSGSATFSSQTSAAVS